MSTKIKITAAIIAKNEEDSIEKCLKSIAFCDEMIVVDDFSTDKTHEIVKSLSKRPEFKNKIIFLQRKLNGDFAAQRNFALGKSKNLWVLFLDCDEVVPEDLKNEILNAIESGKSSNRNGYIIKRQDYFLGKWLKYGETGNIKFIRLAKKDMGLWKGKVHEVFVVKEPVHNLKYPIHHYPHKNISEFLQKTNNYSNLVAQYWKEQGRRSDFFQIVFIPYFKFLKNYVFKLGFLDGIQGFIMAVMMSFHSFQVRSKAYLSQNR